MTRNTNIALVLSVALLGTAIEARADDRYVPGGTPERQGLSCRRRRRATREAREDEVFRN
jgi:hypothetical protein